MTASLVKIVFSGLFFTFFLTFFFYLWGEIVEDHSDILLLVSDGLFFHL